MSADEQRGSMWRCLGCGQALGIVLPYGLQIGLFVTLTSDADVMCRRCGRIRHWRMVVGDREDVAWVLE